MSRPATNRLKINAPMGQRPSLEFRRLRDLLIDPSYQRPTDAQASQTLIRRIAAFWDWSLCQPLSVARRENGVLFIVDGQHRLEAARLRGDIEDLPCVITNYGSAGAEAAAFVALNQQRRPLSKMDLFRAALAASDDAASEVMALIASAGLSLAPHSNYTAWKPGMISNISAVQNCHRIHGAKVTGAALEAMARGFEGQVLQYAGTIFPGIYGFVGDRLRFEGLIDKERLAATLARATQRDWVREIAHESAATGNRRPLAAKSVVARAYESGGKPVAAKAATAPIPIRTAAPARVADPEPWGPGAMAWCNQCDSRVSYGQAGRCQSPFCSMKARA